MTANEPIGLLAGSGRFPIVFAEKARRLERSVVCVGITGEASDELASLVDRFHWCRPLRLNRMIRTFRKEGVSEIVMAGKVRKTGLHSPFWFFNLLPDWRTLKGLYRAIREKDGRDDTLLLAVIEEFAKDGLRFASALDYCPELLVKNGILTRRGPSARESDDIEFGWTMAREMGRLDIGQSVVVKNKSVLAVEAIEGTDQAILRAGELCRKGGFVVVKVAKPRQDMRFDVPVVGVATIQAMVAAGADGLTIDAGKTLVLDGDAFVNAANAAGIVVVGRAVA